jgi:hypothetical protein
MEVFIKAHSLAACRLSEVSFIDPAILPGSTHLDIRKAQVGFQEVLVSGRGEDLDHHLALVW